MSDNRSAVCRICSRIILPVTAKATGGLCRVCQRDERRKRAAAESAEVEVRASKPITREELSALRTSPSSKGAYDALLEKLNWRWQTLGMASLSVTQRTVLAVEVFLAEVLNGGISQFLDHDSGQFANDIPDALNRVGLHEISRAVSVFFGHFREPISLDAEERWNQLKAIEELHGDAIVAALDDQIFGLFGYSDYPALQDRLSAYILANALQFAWQPDGGRP